MFKFIQKYFINETWAEPFENGIQFKIKDILELCKAQNEYIKDLETQFGINYKDYLINKHAESN